MQTFVKILGRQVIWRRRQNALLQFTKKKQRNHTETGYSTKNLQIDRANRSIDLCVLRNACHELFCVFENFFRFLYLLATQDAQATGQLKNICHIARKTNLSSQDTVRAAS